MRVLPDSHILAWFAEDDPKLSNEMRSILEDDSNQMFFSSASIWELTIKKALNRGGFNIEPRVLHRALLDNGFDELFVTSRHAFGVEALPLHHKDPFDRILIAQATTEGILLLTSDQTIAQYDGPIRFVR
jgi:PIN domain nuclease of toxin-antitoxin system